MIANRSPNLSARLIFIRSLDSLDLGIQTER